MFVCVTGVTYVCVRHRRDICLCASLAWYMSVCVTGVIYVCVRHRRDICLCVTGVIYVCVRHRRDTCLCASQAWQTSVCFTGVIYVCVLHRRDICLSTSQAWYMSVCVTGVIASSLANPTDVLKVRLQSGRGTAKEGLCKAFCTIYRQEGVRGLWRVRGVASLGHGGSEGGFRRLWLVRSTLHFWYAAVIYFIVTSYVIPSVELTVEIYAVEKLPPPLQTCLFLGVTTSSLHLIFCSGCWPDRPARRCHRWRRVTALWLLQVQIPKPRTSRHFVHTLPVSILLCTARVMRGCVF